MELIPLAECRRPIAAGVVPPSRARLFDGIRRTLEEGGGEILVSYDAVLIQARRV